MFHDHTTLTLPMGSAAAAAEQVRRFCSAPAAGGALQGCWFSDIGALNQMIVLRGFDTLTELETERLRTQFDADPFGCGQLALRIETHSYRRFPWMPPVAPSASSGIRGPVVEIRTYGIKPGGLQPTLDLWAEYLPPRAALSPCVVAMVALDGPLRFTNIWAYPSLEARSQARAQAVALGLWPPKGGPAWLTTDMHSTIALATAVSPLQ